MKLKYLCSIVFVFSVIHTHAQYRTEKLDSIASVIHFEPEILNLDSILEHKFDTIIKPVIILKKPVTVSKSSHPKSKSSRLADALGKQAFDSLLIVNKKTLDISPSEFKFSSSNPPIKIDSLILKANPFFIELVYLGLPFKFDLKSQPNYQLLYYGYQAKCLSEDCVTLPKTTSPEQFIDELRRDGRNEITKKAAHLYVFTFDQLPDPNGNKSHMITGRRLDKVQFVDEDDAFSADNQKFILKKARRNPWFHKADALAQFTQNSVSSNWYQGGNSNLAVLGILTGKLNYDNKKSVQWDNNAEWRLGFNTVSGDTLRKLNTNDDVLKINSKLGINASGNWFYSGSVDFSTQFFNSYKGVNSTVLKASLFTPVRLNIGFGFDYKYKKMFSLMFSPVAFKYIYISDDVNVDPNIFGIKKGENELSEIGSSMKAVFSHPITKEIQVDSKLSFYTNYKKVEIDWEIVCNMSINRFMSTRISFNPRYDNTIIEKNGDKAGIQYKQLLSVGFSHKFR